MPKLTHLAAAFGHHLLPLFHICLQLGFLLSVAVEEHLIPGGVEKGGGEVGEGM